MNSSANVQRYCGAQDTFYVGSLKEHCHVKLLATQ
ncbi:hypothetical protein QF001_000023 [Paraburkholderia youngii]